VAVASGRAADGLEPRELFGLPAAVIHADRDVVRVLYTVTQAGARRGAGRFVVMVRAVETRDFMTAKPSDVPLAILKGLAERVLEDSRVSLVAYDLTSKPPATVEFE
jgi:GMP synthase PP-ATPase subunit